jgi:hypothetical protein
MSSALKIKASYSYSPLAYIKRQGIRSQTETIKTQPLLLFFTLNGGNREQWQPNLNGEQFHQQFVQN